MTNLLALETTTDVCSVGIDVDGDWLEETHVAPRMHNELVLAMVDRVLRAAEIERAQLDHVAFSAGPGSFTGVRIGASVTQGIAFALNAGIVRVPTSAALARGLAALMSEPTDEMLVRRHSRPGWWYEARYRMEQQIPVCTAFDVLKQGDITEPLEDDRMALSARFVASAALAYLRGEDAAPNPDIVLTGEPRQALPFYVEGDSPWQPSR